MSRPVTIRIDDNNLKFWESLPDKKEWLNTILQDAQFNRLYSAEADESKILDTKLKQIKLREAEFDLKRKVEFTPIQDRMKTEAHAVDMESKKVKMDRDRLQADWLKRQNDALDRIEARGGQFPVHSSTIIKERKALK